MTIDVYTATGQKKGTAQLPAALFEAPVKMSLLHQAVVLQQSNRRASIAHVKTRSEIRGSTRKLYAQKGTGRARRGAIRSSILKGGNKAFGPRNESNFFKHMPKKMRHAALFGSLSLQAKNGIILGLESYPSTIKTKEAFALLKKLPIEIGRPILFVLPDKQSGLALSLRNIPRVKSILAAYLNPEDVLHARHIVFLTEAIKKAEEVFTGDHKVKKPVEAEIVEEKKEAQPKKATKAKKAKSATTAKKAAAKGKSSKSSIASDSSISSSK